MFTNLKQHDKFVERCRQLLPGVRITPIRNLALLAIGLLNITECHLSSLVEVIPLAIADLSIEKRMYRWLKNQALDVREWCEPFVRTALVLYAPQTLYVVMDTTKYGPSCQALVAGLAYGGGQVIPLGWRVLNGKKGHTKASVQEKLLAEIRASLPDRLSSLPIANSVLCPYETPSVSVACYSPLASPFSGRSLSAAISFTRPSNASSTAITAATALSFNLRVPLGRAT